ncbi:MAG: fluoride efflux transporter CrcB [Alistipes sp.]|nr:fluoride efflux transporter CrcB [Alistipes sp.]
MHFHLKEILLVGAGGFAGSACRYLVSLWIVHGDARPAFPLATLAVNAAGSLLIGIFIALAAPHWLQLVLVTGFCGGFTTFSAFSAEMVALLKGGQPWAAAGYALASVALCVAMAAAGIFIGGKLKGI